MADRYPYHSDPVGARDHGGAARGAEGDPLAELARLIGQDANALPGRAAKPRSQATPLPHYQDRDQYQDQEVEPVHEEPAPPSWMRAAASTGWPQQQAAPEVQPVTQEPAHYEQDQQEDMPSFLRAARHSDPARYDPVLYDQNALNETQPYADNQYQYQDGYQDQADPNAYPGFYGDAVEEEPKKRRGGLLTVVAVLALAVVGTAAAYGYRSYTGAPRSGEPPVVKAEPGPNKIVPPTQTSDASGKIVDRIAGGASGGGERVLSREEQPIDINGRNAPRVVFPPLNQGGSTVPQAMASAQPAAPPQTSAVVAAPPQAGANGALGDEPKRVRTLAIRPDQPDAVPQQSSAPAPRPTQARAQVPQPSSSGGPMSIAPQSSANAAPVRTAAVSSGSGGYMVQVSSQRSEADAQASYRAMQSKFPNVLGSRTASIRRADLGEKGVYYRALIGPFAAAEEAGNLCNSLKSAGGQCVVQRN